MAAFEGVWQPRTEFTIQKLFGPKWPKWVLGDPKRAFFSSEISAGCAFGCKYFSVGWVIQKGPEGSKVCAKTSLNLIRHSNPEILHFEWKKNVHSPPPVKKRGQSFKGPKNMHKTISDLRTEMRLAAGIFLFRRSQTHKTREFFEGYDVLTQDYIRR